jgi:hypothetical protein
MTGGAMGELRNVFISHIHEDDAGLQKLKDLLDTKGLTVRDGSIHKGKFNKAEDENYIKTQLLAPRINWAGTLICYVTPETKNSEWVNWEIEYAAKQGMRIVGVWAHGEAGCELPDALKEYADAIVGWNGNAIADAMDGKDVCEMPDGSSCAVVPLKRHPCS